MAVLPYISSQILFRFFVRQLGTRKDTLHPTSAATARDDAALFFYFLSLRSMETFGYTSISRTRHALRNSDQYYYHPRRRRRCHPRCMRPRRRRFHPEITRTQNRARGRVRTRVPLCRVIEFTVRHVYVVRTRDASKTPTKM